MDKRIFFAIQISAPMKEKLASFQYQWLKLPIHWVAPVNLHITLLFVGQAKTEGVGKMSEIIHDIAQAHNPFTLEFNQIKLKPDIYRPNLLWVEGKENQYFSQLSQNIEDVLREEKLYFSNISRAKKQIPHITLGRIRKWQWRQIEPEERPGINESLTLKIPVNEIALVESKLHRQGPEYFILETARLNSR